MCLTSHQSAECLSRSAAAAAAAAYCSTMMAASEQQLLLNILNIIYANTIRVTYILI